MPMRYLITIKAAENTPHSPELDEAVGRLSRKMADAGVLLEAAGLAPSGMGARLRLNGDKLILIDGPFVPTQDIIGGYAVLNASSKAEAIELGRTFMQLHADILGPSFEAECEIRQVSDAPGGRS